MAGKRAVLARPDAEPRRQPCAISLKASSRRCAHHLVMSDPTRMVPFISAEKSSDLVTQFGTLIRSQNGQRSSSRLTGISMKISLNSTRPSGHVREVSGPSAP